jgi:hypothetical protein
VVLLVSDNRTDRQTAKAKTIDLPKILGDIISVDGWNGCETRKENKGLVPDTVPFILNTNATTINTLDFCYIKTANRY